MSFDIINKVDVALWLLWYGILRDLNKDGSCLIDIIMARFMACITAILISSIFK